jgi:hypothetical protein
VSIFGSIPGIGGIGNLAGMLGGGGQAKSPTAGRNVFKKVLSHGDWWDAALETTANTIALKAGVYQTIGRFTIPAQQMYRFGYGAAAFPDNQGYMHFAAYDDTATNSVVEDGSLRLVQRNAQGTVQLVVAEYRTEQLRGSVSNRQQMVALPEQTQFPVVGEDSILELQLKPDAADSIVKTAIGTAAGLDIWNIPVTVYQ